MTTFCAIGGCAGGHKPIDWRPSEGVMDLSSLLKRYVTGLWPWAPKRPSLSQVHRGRTGIVRASTLASKMNC